MDGDPLWGLRSSQTRVRLPPPITICRIFVGDNQFTVTCAMPPEVSGIERYPTQAFPAPNGSDPLAEIATDPVRQEG